MGAQTPHPIQRLCGLYEGIGPPVHMRATCLIYYNIYIYIYVSAQVLSVGGEAAASAVMLVAAAKVDFLQYDILWNH